DRQRQSGTDLGSVQELALERGRQAAGRHHRDAQDHAESADDPGVEGGHRALRQRSAVARRAPAARRAHAGPGKAGHHGAQVGRLLDAGPAIAKPRPRSKPLSPPGPSLALATPLLVAAALLLYWSGLRFPLVFDDYNLNAFALRTHYATAVTRLTDSR